MGMKVKGIREAQQKLNALIDDVQTRKAPRAIQSALILIGSEAAVLTPIDTSTLVNSQFRELMISGTLLTGRIGYSANYAVYVHNASGKLKGKPRSSVNEFTTKSGKKAFSSNQGNFWDPGGEPHFLTKGAQNAKEAVNAVILKEMKL